MDPNWKSWERLTKEQKDYAVFLAPNLREAGRWEHCIFLIKGSGSEVFYVEDLSDVEEVD